HRGGGPDLAALGDRDRRARGARAARPVPHARGAAAVPHGRLRRRGRTLMTRLRATNPSGTDGRPARSLPAPSAAATSTARDGAGRTTTRSRPRPRSRPRREQVLDGAGQLFAEYGYYG